MTAPIPIASGQRLTPARLNPPPWTSYTPQWTASTTNPVLNNGTLTGKYRYLDTDLVAVRIRLDIGSTTSVGSGQYSFSLPVPAAAGAPDPTLDAVALLGSQLYVMLGWKDTKTAPASSVAMYRVNVTSQEQTASWTNAAPVAVAAGNTFSMYGIYFVA